MGIRQELQMRYRDGCGFKPGDFLVPKDNYTAVGLMVKTPVFVISQNPTTPYQYWVGAKHEFDDRFKELQIDGFEWRKEDE